MTYVQPSAPTHHYYDEIDTYDYDSTIVAHPFMDQIKASIVATVAVQQYRLGRPLAFLDAGTGTGQLARCIRGLGRVQVELADIDPAARSFARNSPSFSICRSTRSTC